MMNFVMRGAAIILGLIFVLSGWLKGVDPFGASLKIKEYLNLFQFNFLEDSNLLLAIFISAFEMLLGFLLITGLYRKFIAVITLVVMLGFTTLTCYLAFNPLSAIQECGCFGDAISMTNTQTFIKNLVLLVLVVIYIYLLFNRYKPTKYIFITQNIIAPIYLLFLALLIPLYSLIYLPPFDFLSFNRGTDLLSNPKFAVFDSEFKDITDSLLLDNGKLVFTIITHEKLDNSILTKLSPIIEMYQVGELDCFVLTSTEQDQISGLPLYYVDEVTLKSMIRAKSGAMLLDQGVVLGKWHIAYSSFEDFNIDNLDELILSEENVVLRYWITIFISLLIGCLIIHIYKQEKI